MRSTSLYSPYVSSHLDPYYLTMERIETSDVYHARVRRDAWARPRPLA